MEGCCVIAARQLSIRQLSIRQLRLLLQPEIRNLRNTVDDINIYYVCIAIHAHTHTHTHTHTPGIPE